MSKPIAFMTIGAALLAGAVLPAAAADLYGYEAGGGPPAFEGRGDVAFEGERARVVRGDAFRPAGYGWRRPPGPVVYDARGPEPFDGDRFGGPVPLPRAAWGYGERGEYGPPAGFAPRPGGEFGYVVRPAAAFRPVAAFRAGGPAFGGGFGAPDLGCTFEQARSVTPAGWQKTVTQRVCYRR